MIHADGELFALSNAHFTYAFRIGPEGRPEHLHFGPPVCDPAQLPVPRRVQRACAVHAGGMGGPVLEDSALEWPTAGQGDFRTPAIRADRLLDFRYGSHTVTGGRPDLAPLPSARGEGARTLSVTLRDDASGAEVDLHYTVWADFGVLARSATVRNTGDTPLTLREVASLSLGIAPALGSWDALHLHGTWAHEMNAERVPLPHARLEVASTRGTSSAAHAPFLALLERGATETAGRVVATTLVWSGNHVHSAEVGEYGHVRLRSGIGPLDIALEPDGTFQTPEALLVTTDGGLGAMSHLWHSFVRERVLPERSRGVPRPTYLNTWEAGYFDVDESRVLDFAERAVELGVEMLVLDDGWFRGRTDDRRALGDWSADPDRFPSGIPALADKVRAKGLKFGLWFEPEMVSRDSDLFRAHPEWVLADWVPGEGGVLSEGRHQLVLDMGREDVRDHVRESVGALLPHLDYVKWDMNRAHTDVMPLRSFRHTLGLYGVLRDLADAYPHVLWENCASGGNRFDLGMLSFMDQSWTSDMCDPVGRAAVVAGASLFLPLDCMAAYVGPSPNHQNGRGSPLHSRWAAGAMCGAQGLSLPASAITDDLEELRGYVERMRATARERLGATFHRLATDDPTVWQTVAADGGHVTVFALRTLARPNAPLRRVRLRGLDPDALYESDAGTASGRTLMARGLDLPHVEMGDFRAQLLHFHRR